MRAGDLVQSDSGHVWAVICLIDGEKARWSLPVVYALVIRAANLGSRSKHDDADLVYHWVPARDLRVVAASDVFIFEGRKFLHDGEPAIVVRCDDTKFLTGQYYPNGERFGIHRGWLALNLFHRLHDDALNHFMVTRGPATEAQL